ncbi:MAG: disulfide bond formation protein B, partial [Steroidobacteraceae bacterium]|nr:disulfide bond formation protein B [Steroidobacteraceae bacterium]MDW8258888.1 disulfide bond formation protein B [Gammaproteobacteria bacterium]
MRWLAARRRAVNALAAATCVALLAYALYAEKVLGLEPCPLCMLQRAGVAALGAAFLLAAAHHPRRLLGARLYAALIFLVGLFPTAAAARHLYIQSQPAGTVPTCGATLEYMLEVFPLTEVLRKVFTGGGECVRVDWQWLGISMPGWVLVSVVALVTVGMVANGRH